MDTILNEIHQALGITRQHLAANRLSPHAQPRLEDLRIVDFETTEAFNWLARNADLFDFRLSYPRENSMGIIYEPWHWYYTGV